jgi:sugar lactone lactonase YvrE
MTLATVVWAGPSITAIPSVILAGDAFIIEGTGFTKGSVVNFFVANALFPMNYGPLTPGAWTPAQLRVDVPASISLGQGFVTVQVVNTDQGYSSSNLAYALLQGSAAAGFPSLTSINGIPLAATSTDPNFATDNVETVVPQGKMVTLGGTGFDITSGVAVDLFCACPGEKVGPFFLAPGDPGLSSKAIKFIVPSTGADAPPTGPGSFVVSNKGAGPTIYGMKSNAVSVPIGQEISITKAEQSGCGITVSGSGFSSLTVINLFNEQSGKVVNLGGLGRKGPNIPLKLAGSTQLSFGSPLGLVPGPAYVQVLNAPFLPFTSTGTSPVGLFTASDCITPESQGLWVPGLLDIWEFAGYGLTVNGPPSVYNASLDISYATGVTFDSSLNLWSTNCTGGVDRQGSVTEFTLAQLKNLHSVYSPPANVVISDDVSGHSLDCPQSLQFDKTGNLWVSNPGVSRSDPSLVEFTATQLSRTGSPTPNTVIISSDWLQPGDIEFDQSGNLWMTDSRKVVEFRSAQLAKGGAQRAGTIVASASLDDPIALEFNSIGDLWVTNCSNSTLVLFAAADLSHPGILTPGPKVTISATDVISAFPPTTSLECPNGLAFDRSGNLWVSSFGNSISEFSPGQIATTGSPAPILFINTVTNPRGLTFGPAIQ